MQEFFKKEYIGMDLRIWEWEAKYLACRINTDLLWAGFSWKYNQNYSFWEHRFRDSLHSWHEPGLALELSWWPYSTTPRPYPGYAKSEFWFSSQIQMLVRMKEWICIKILWGSFLFYFPLPCSLWLNLSHVRAEKNLFIPLNKNPIREHGTEVSG